MNNLQNLDIGPSEDELNLVSLQDSCKKKLRALISGLDIDLAKAERERNWHLYTNILIQLNKFKVQLTSIDSLSKDEIEGILKLN